MRIEVKRLQDHPVDVEIDCRPSDLELSDEDFEFAGRVTGTLAFRLIEQRVFAHGQARVSAATQCVRCLKRITVLVEAEVDAIYEHNEQLLNPESRFLGSEDQFISYYDGETVHPEPEIREALLAELPLLPVCDEQCQGLCPQCGADLNSEKCSCAPADVSENPWKAQIRKLKIE